MHPSIKKTKGPCIILAGAGTGKTYTIVEKVKYIIQNKIYDPEKIVCLTFSNEAANSLHERVAPILKENQEPIIKTFHSFCAELLREHGDKIGINSKFTILTPDNAKILIHKNFKISPNSCHKYVNAMHTAKDLGITQNEFKEHIDKNLPKKTTRRNRRRA